MTENEAKEMLRAKLTCMNLEDLACVEKGCSRNCDDCEYNYTQGARGQQEEAIKIAIGVFEEIQHYRTLGTVEELRELVSKGKAYGQVAWERNIAISQLEEIGCSLGEKMDEVKEAREK